MAERSKPITLTDQEKDTPRRLETIWQRAMRHLRQDRLTLAALGVIVIITLMVILAPVITTLLGVNSEKTNPSDRLLPPGTPGHILGTDDLGRDYLARSLYGGQIYLAIG